MNVGRARPSVVLAIAATILLFGLVLSIIDRGKTSKDYERDLAIRDAEIGLLQVHGEGMYSKWAAEKSEAGRLGVENARLARVADSLHLQVTTKSRLELKWKTIAESLAAVQDTTELGETRVRFALHQDGVSVMGHTLTPPPRAVLEIVHDPITMVVHIGRTKTGFTKGLIEVPPYLEVSDWALVVDENVGKRSWWPPDLRAVVGGGGGPEGAHVIGGLRSGKWGAAAHFTTDGYSATIDREFQLLGGDR